MQGASERELVNDVRQQVNGGCNVRQRMVCKIAIDITMTLLLLFLMGYQIWGDFAHERAGAGMLVFFLFHNLMNRKWYAAMFSGTYTTKRIIRLIVNLLLIADMIFLMTSGMIMSNHVFTFLDFRGHMGAARMIHIIASHWGFILMAVHIGMHWSMATGAARKKGLKLSGGETSGVVIRITATLAAVYGICAFCKRDMLTYMTGRAHFVYFDFSEPGIFYYADIVAIMTACIYFIYYAFKRLN